MKLAFLSVLVLLSPPAQLEVPMRMGTPSGASVEVNAEAAPVATNEMVVPDVTGLSQDEARKKITAAGFEGSIKVEELYCSEGYEKFPPGVVCGTEPKAGRTTLKKHTISLLVQGPREWIPMPDLVGKPYAEARKILVDAGFRKFMIKYESGWKEEGCDVGIVCATNPKAGEKASFRLTQIFIMQVPKGKVTGYEKADEPDEEPKKE